MRSPLPRPILALCLGALALVPIAPAGAQDGAGETQASEIQRFCTNIADGARDKRYALQAAELARLQEEIDRRIALLEEKRAEYEGWLKRREEFLAMADGSITEIYAKMRPDAAAERLAQLRVDLAAAIVMKLEPRKASVILNEMDAKVAASVTGIMASAARKADPS
ncbi:MAG: MotE family protein [Rhizobiaceae bacterium]|nr:MotE family protein [Rhizobiaceae bacterium]MCV0407018.1 MotE family protein [Rhizobiaceae bacterium]